MVREGGGLVTAHRLLAQLFLLGRLDLTVEDHVLQPEFAPLFREVDRAAARARLGLSGSAGGVR